MSGTAEGSDTAERSGSWPPQTDSAKSGREPETEVSESAGGKSLDELPTPEEKLSEFLDEFGSQAHTPLSRVHNRPLRPECVEEEKEAWEDETAEGEAISGVDQVECRAVPLWQGVAEMLDWHESYHKSTLRLEYGEESDPTHTLLDVDLDNSWFASYQEKERAKLKALERETCGYETCEECGTRYCQEPEDHATEYVEGRFEQPVVALTGRTASGAGRPPVDHARSIADAWASGGVRRSLRYVIDKLGLSGDEWVRWTQGEPHPGEGENQGYHHAHDIVILDAGEIEEEITAETFRPVIESHVEKCEYAGPQAHDLHLDWGEAPSSDECDCQNGCDECVGTVSVKYVEGEIEESVASYAASYLANEQLDLLERPPEYLAWAATMWATDTQRGIKSDSANHAIAADRCKHAHENGDQETAHGEQVTYSDKRGCTAECLMCGSPWGVEQEETLVAAKRVAGPETAVADGGSVACRESREETVEEELRDRWSNAREAARVGCEAALRPVADRDSGEGLDGQEIRHGGGESYCAACGEIEPDETEECSAEAYKDAEYEVFCPLPPEHFGAHTVQEGADNPDRTGRTGSSDRFRGDGHIPFEYECPPDTRGEVVGFERPPTWKAKSVIRDGEEIPATGGTTKKKPLNLPSAPKRVVSMAARSGGVAVCQECDEWLDTPGEVVDHECSAPVFVGFIGGGVKQSPEVSCPRCGHSFRADPRADRAKCPVCAEVKSRYSFVEAEVPTVGVPGEVRETPAAETALEYEEFVEAIPPNLLGGGEEGEEEPPVVPEKRVRAFVECHPDVSVAGVLGEFELPPSAQAEVERIVEAGAPE